MTTRLQTPTHLPSLCQAIADQNHGLSLKMLQQLPLRNRWNTLFLLNRTFAKGKPKDYLRALTHNLLYRAYREELAGNTDEASRMYRLLIQHSAGRKITQKAREGYMRIASAGKPSSPTVSRKPSAKRAANDRQTHAKRDEQTPPVAPPSRSRTPQFATISEHETSLVLLQPVALDQKQALAIKLAEILNTDPYTARLTLPSIEFRMLRYGLANSMGQLHQQLAAAGVLSHHLSLQAIQSIQVYDVLYIVETSDDSLVVQVREPKHPNQSNSIELKWSDIQQSVNALLPLFEEVIDLNSKREITRKTTTQDHAQIIDLHLNNQQGILRFYDAGYQFNQGIPLVASDNPRAMLDTKTSWAQWQGLKQLLNRHLPSVLEHHKFDNFATNAVEQIELLTKIEAHIHLLRRNECYWDQTFHLYSALHYLQLN